MFVDGTFGIPSTLDRFGRMNAQHPLWELHKYLEQVFVKPDPKPRWNRPDEKYLEQWQGRHRQELVL